MAPVPYAVTEDGRVQLSRTGEDGAIAPGESRTLYVAAPFHEASVTFAEGARESFPVTAVFDAQVAAVGDGVDGVYSQCLTTETPFAATAMGDGFLTDEQSEAANQTSGAIVPTAPELVVPEPDKDAEADDPSSAPAPEPEAPVIAKDPDDGDAPENYRERPDLAPRQLLSAFTGSTYLTRTMLESPGIRPFASETVERLPTTYLDPNLHIGNGTAVPGQTNTVMIKTGDTIYMTLQ